LDLARLRRIYFIKSARSAALSNLKSKLANQKSRKGACAMRYSMTRKSLRRAACGVAAFVLWLLPAAANAANDEAKLLRKQAEQAVKRGDFAEAEEIYNKILASHPKDNKSRLGLSYALLKQRYWGGAFDQAAKVLDEERFSTRARAILGTALLANGEFRAASEAFQAALLIDENEALAVAGLGMIEFYENRTSNSVSLLRRAVALDDDEPDFVFSLAQAAARDEKFKEAADAFERFLRIAPKTDDDRRSRIRGLINFLRYVGQRGKLYQHAGDNATVPLGLVTTRPVVQVRVNGDKEPQSFVFDTGSGMCVISEDTAKRLGVKAIARGGNARAVGGEGKFEIVYGFLDSLQIGDVTVYNVPVYIRRFHGNANEVDGYLGTAAISKYLTTVDYSARTFSLNKKRKTAKHSSPAVELPMRTTSSGFISGEVQIEGVNKPLNFIIDTGASISVLSDKLAGREELASFREGVRMRVFGAAGVEEDVKTLVLPRVLVGTHSQRGVSAAVLDLDSINETTGFEQTGIIGGNFLFNYRITFDFKRGVLRLETQPGGGNGPAPGPTSTVAARQ
jgi:predicted aspartyl protease/thioredoxin-like negative regulator of GroEL